MAMTNSKYFILILGLVITSCSFNSSFFAVDKQDPDSEIADLDFDKVYIDAADGKKILCHFYKPTIDPSSTIFLLQGSGDNITSWSSYADYFVRAGYEVFMMEYRGFGEDLGKATHRNVLLDAEKALIKLTNMDAVKDRKIILLGQSYGGQIAINLTSRYPEKVAALVTEGTFTSFNEEVIYQVPGILKPFLYLFVYSPYKSKELIKEINGIPLLIIHSKDDEIVPLKMGKELYANANEPKYFWEITGEHNHGIEEHTEEYLEKLNDLVKTGTSKQD